MERTREIMRVKCPLCRPVNLRDSSWRHVRNVARSEYVGRETASASAADVGRCQGVSFAYAKAVLPTPQICHLICA